MDNHSLKNNGSGLSLWIVGMVAAALFVTSCKKSEPTTQQSESAPEVSVKEEKEQKTVVEEVAVEPKQEIQEEAQQPIEQETIPMNEAMEVDSEPVAKRAPAAPKVNVPVVPAPVEIVTDPALIKVYPGADRPKVGDKVYTHTNLPKDACGTYWVRNDDGMVETLSVCRDEH